MKKMFSVICCLSLVLALVLTASACKAAATNEVHEVYIDLNEMEIGDTIIVGDLVFEKAQDDATFPSNSGVRMTTEGFTVSNFGGNTSLNKDLVLNSAYQYFWILVNNEGARMNVTIGKDGNDEYFANVSTGSLYIYSTQAWSADTHVVSFSCDSGMEGSANAMLCSTLEEAKAHNKDCS